MQTVGNAIKSLLPDGTLGEGAKGPKTYRQCPSWPGDVFGVAAYLLDRSGAYQRVVAASGAYNGHEGDDERPDFPRILITQENRIEAKNLARLWKNLDVDQQTRPPAEIDRIWREMIEEGWDDQLIAPIHGLAPEAPGWWHRAMMLLMIADNAAEGLGYPFPDEDDADEEEKAEWYEEDEDRRPNWIQRQAGEELFQDYARYKDQELRHDWLEGWVHNWSFLIDESICCVVPKSSAPEVGCTLRALSHNLALVPSAGEARASWWVPEQPPGIDARALNLLLVPFPYWIPARSFDGQKNIHGNRVFDVKQTWLPDREHFDDFRKFLNRCLRKAKKQVGEVHGLIFPELSLNAEFFEDISTFAREQGIRVFIAGVSESEFGDGNQVVAEVNLPDTTEPTLTTVRQKHHRWKIEKNQVKAYGLGDTLNPKYDWWEKLRVAHRSIDVFALSERSTCTTLVCEDLARIDPCQRLIRAIGPSLVIALLMDGPQLGHRWPARYATVLAEDPGASVLTFTSLGLIARGEHQGRSRKRVIGLWKERSGDEIPITLRDDSHAVLLTLRGDDKRATTMDGRRGPVRTEWSLVGQIQLSGGKDIAPWILDGQRVDEEDEETVEST